MQCSAPIRKVTMGNKYQYSEVNSARDHHKDIYFTWHYETSSFPCRNQPWIQEIQR